MPSWSEKKTVLRCKVQGGLSPWTVSSKDIVAATKWEAHINHLPLLLLVSSWEGFWKFLFPKIGLFFVAPKSLTLYPFLELWIYGYWNWKSKISFCDFIGYRWYFIFALQSLLWTQHFCSCQGWKCSGGRVLYGSKLHRHSCKPAAGLTFVVEHNPLRVT